MGLGVALVLLSAVVAEGWLPSLPGPVPAMAPATGWAPSRVRRAAGRTSPAATGASFASGAESTAYAAGGGTLQPKPTYAQARAL
jgi:hypothetical protein